MNARALVFAIFLLVMAPGAVVAGQPNIIVILTDDMGYGDLSINGSALIKTPKIDSIAHSGINFTSFYASASLCSPSRAGLLTGRYPVRSGMAAGVVVEGSETGLPLEEITLAELLLDAGYRTAMVGKWHLGNRMPFWPTRHGFEYFYGVQHSNDMLDFALFRDEERIESPVEQSTLTKRYTEEAVNFIRAAGDTPFFLYLSHTFPHIPLHVSEDAAGKSAAGLYGDVIEELDWSTGEIIATLRDLEILDDTIIVFTSDNGAWWEGSGGSSRGMKAQTWDGAFRVPMLVSWPSRIPRGRRTAEPAMNIDILPTLAAAASVSPGEAGRLDGKNLLPLMTGTSEKSPHDYLYFFTDEELVAVRSGRWKLVTHGYHRRSLAALENVESLNGFDGPYLLLFDMQGPAPGRYSFARENPAIVRRLHGELSAARVRFDPLRTRAPIPVYPPPP